MPRKKTARAPTLKQRLFVAEYLKLHSGRKAAIAAGYPPKAATKTGCKLLRNPAIRAMIAEAGAAVTEAAQLDAARVLKELERLGLADLRRCFNEDGTLKAITDLPDDVAAAVAGVEVIEKRHGQRLYKIRLWDKNAALTNLAKHFGMLKEMVELGGKVTVQAEEYTGMSNAEFKKLLLEAAESL